MAITLGVAASPASALVIVNVIPNADSGESAQNSEPNIGVNPANPAQAVISAFGPIISTTPFVLMNPYFATGNGGATWSRFDNVTHADTTLDYSRDGATAYMARLGPLGNNILAFGSSNPPGGVGWTAIPASSYTVASAPDQPWIQTGRGVDPISGTVKDRLYVGFNDLSKSGGVNGKTASVRFSTDGGATFANKVLETVTPLSGQDGPAVRVAVNGSTVYAAWVRWDASTSVTGGTVFNSTIMIRRDDSGATGATQFGALGAGGNGVTIVSNQTVFTSSANSPASLGNERIGSDLSVAVDPGHANHVYVAFAEVPGAAASGQVRVRVMESTDSGATWTQKFVTPTDPNFRAALPALAVTANGQVGLMYTAFNALTNKLEQHFVQTANNFGSVTDSVLERFTNGDRAISIDIDPYLGDFMDLVAVGDTFYGTFSSSNNLNDAEFPSGLPTFQRNTATIGGVFLLEDGSGARVPFSIDPYFFSVSVATPEPASLLLLSLGLAGLSGRAWRRRRRN